MGKEIEEHTYVESFIFKKHLLSSCSVLNGMPRWIKQAESLSRGVLNLTVMKYDQI